MTRTTTRTTMTRSKKRKKKTPPPPPRRSRRRQRGTGLDIQKWLGKTGIEFHWPGYQYMGPGTHLKKRLARGDPVINPLDRISKQHDIDYSKAKNLRDKWNADAKMIKSIENLPGNVSSCKKFFNWNTLKKLQLLFFEKVSLFS